MINNEFYEFLLKVHSIAKIGQVYSRDPYAIVNYKEINDLTRDMLENFVNVKFNRPSMFSRDIYPTPNVSVRTVIFNELGQVLLVREKVDGGYSLPGGWCDLYESPSEAAIKECLQEAGADVKIVRLLGILNRTPFKGPLNVPEYMIAFKGEIKGPFVEIGFETTDARFFDIDKLPPICPKVRVEEVLKMINAAQTGMVMFD